MTFSVLDRIFVLNILAQVDEGDITTWKIVQQLKLAAGFSEEEVEKYELKSENGQAFWNPATAEDKEIAIGPKAKKIVAGVLEKLNKANKLKDVHISLYDKFAESKDELSLAD